MTLMIGENSVVSIHYTLKNDDGDTLDSSKGKQPLTYLHGANNLIPGLETELQGKTVGAKFDATIPPQQAYGENRDELVQVLKKEMFQGVESIEPGMSFVARSESGQEQQVRVTAVSGEDVTIDANHPMAGLTVHFKVEVVEVREGTEQEIEHGHVHQAGEDH